jgi:hypothetical protein
MKFVVAISFPLLLLSQTIVGQNKYSGKTFVNDKLDQIDFVNDSVLVASFRAFPEKYEFNNGTLTLTLLHHHNDMEFQHSYKLLYSSLDTICFVYTSLPDNKPDTMRFTNIRNRIIKVRDFDSLRVDMYGYMGSKRLIIRKNKTVKFSDKADVMPNEEFPTYKYFTLTNKQYENFIGTLSKCLIFMLPEKRSEDGDDITYVDFAIHTNGVTYK